MCQQSFSKLKLAVLLGVLTLAASIPNDPDCPRECADIYDPVCADCGENRITFSNECELRSLNCQGNDCVYKFGGDCYGTIIG